nr:hypothetical protein [Rhodococcus sp. (in: high G+C Gram-positive bacteria)]
MKKFRAVASAIVVAGVLTACQRFDVPEASPSAYIDGLPADDARFADVLVEAGFDVDADNFAGFTRRAVDICSGFAGGTTFAATVGELGATMSWQKSAALSRASVARHCPESEAVVDAYFRQLEGGDGAVAPQATAPSEIPPASPLPPSPGPLPPAPRADIGQPCSDVGVVGLDPDGGQFVCGSFPDGSIWVDTVLLVGIHEADTECDPSIDGGSQTSAGRAVMCVDGTWQFGP